MYYIKAFRLGFARLFSLGERSISGRHHTLSTLSGESSPFNPAPA